jgi:hypothetical protein
MLAMPYAIKFMTWLRPWRRDAGTARPSRTLPDVLQKMQKIAIELLRILQESEMTYTGLEQQSGIWDFFGHEFGILALNGLIVISVRD